MSSERPPEAPLGYLSGPPGSRVPQYESFPVPMYPEGGPECPSCGEVLRSGPDGESLCINPECEEA